MKLASSVKRSAPMSWRVVTPQLMGRAVRQHEAWWVAFADRVSYSMSGPQLLYMQAAVGDVWPYPRSAIRFPLQWRCDNEMGQMA